MSKDAKSDEFDWIQFKTDLDAPYKTNSETFKQKFNRKFSENPFIPVGCLATAAALTYGLYCFRKGDSKKSQIMMRLRIAAQGFTVAALLGGVFVAATKQTPHQKNISS